MPDFSLETNKESAMRVAILGGPGSGKGTQAKILSERYRVPQISTGDLLRDATKNDQILDEEAKRAMAEGRLVDNTVVLKLLDERLRKRDTKRGFIIDGYPRNIPQAQALDTLLGMLGKTLQIAINIDVDDNALVKRIIGRLGCDHCGAIYSRRFSPPRVKSKCDRCGGMLVSRADDTAKTARVRIAVYHQETIPLITYYRAQHKLRTVPGVGEVDEIHQKLCEVVDLEIRPLEIKTLETAADTNDEINSTIIAGGQINRIELDTTANKTPPKKKPASRAPISPVKTKASTAPAKKTAKRASAKPSETKATDKTLSKKKVPVKKSTQKKQVPSKPISAMATKKKPLGKKSKVAKVVAKQVVKKVAEKITKKIITKNAQKTAPAKKKLTKKSVAKKPTLKKSVIKKTVAKKITKKPASKKPTVRKVADTIAKKTIRKKITKKIPTKKITKKIAEKSTSKKSTASKPTKKTPKKTIRKKITKKHPSKKTAKNKITKKPAKKIAKKKTRK